MPGKPGTKRFKTLLPHNIIDQFAQQTDCVGLCGNQKESAQWHNIVKNFDVKSRIFGVIYHPFELKIKAKVGVLSFKIIPKPSLNNYKKL